MNISIHVIGSIATAGALSSGHKDDGWNVPRLAGGFVLGILIHGILDLLPHTYPIPPKLDVLLAALIFVVALYFVPKRNRLLLCACFVGAIIPDVIDHGPLILQKYAGVEIPRLSTKIFPWHWKEFSGSIYDQDHRVESLVCHLIVLAIFGTVIVVRRRELLPEPKD